MCGCVYTGGCGIEGGAVGTCTHTSTIKVVTFNVTQRSYSFVCPPVLSSHCLETGQLTCW